MRISNERKKALINFQQKYNLDFSDISLLNQAFVHTSYTNENNIDVANSYEKLEFLGDAVLKLAISDFFYENFPDYSEGDLTDIRSNIVSDRNISNYALKLDFKKLLILGRNEEKQGGKNKSSILACAFEALLGAIFLEYKNEGYQKAKSFLKENFINDILSITDSKEISNPKATLQEYTQSIDHQLPVYNIVKEQGPSHNKTFFATVSYNNKIIGKGSAKTIKDAHQKAALSALKKIKRDKNE